MLIGFKKGTLDKLKTLNNIQPGTFYYTMDTGCIYFAPAGSSKFDDLVPFANNVSKVEAETIDDKSYIVFKLADGTEAGRIALTLPWTDVYLSEDLVVTEKIGAIELTDIGGLTKTFPANTTNIKTILTNVLSKTYQPTKINQNISATLKYNGNKTYGELGTMITPSFSISFDDGKYEIRNSNNTIVSTTNNTGSIVTWTKITQNDEDVTSTYINTSNKNSTTISGTLGASRLSPSGYIMKYSAECTEGDVAKNNLGEDSNPIIRVPSQIFTDKIANIQSYRYFFYGCLKDENLINNVSQTDDISNPISNLNNLAGDKIRKTDGNMVLMSSDRITHLSVGQTYTQNYAKYLKTGTRYIVISVPVGYTLSSVMYKSPVGEPTNETASFSRVIRYIPDANGGNLIEYNVYYWKISASGLTPTDETNAQIYYTIRRDR